MTYLLIITLAPSPIPSQILHTLFDTISLGMDAVLCHDYDTCMTVHTCPQSKMPQYNIMNNAKLFSQDWFQGNSMCIDRRQSTQLRPYHSRGGGERANPPPTALQEMLYGTSVQKCNMMVLIVTCICHE